MIVSVNSRKIKNNKLNKTLLSDAHNKLTFQIFKTLTDPHIPGDLLIIQQYTDLRFMSHQKEVNSIRKYERVVKKM